MQLTAAAAADYFQQIEGCLAETEAPQELQFLRLRQVLEAAAEELTRDSPQYFSALFNRLIYIEDAARLKETHKRAIHSFRKLANSVVHGTIKQVSPQDFRQSVLGLCDYIAYFANMSIPTSLVETLNAPKPAPTAEALRAPTPAVVQTPFPDASAPAPAPTPMPPAEAPQLAARMRGVVLRVGDLEQRTTPDGRPFEQRRLFVRIEAPADSALETAAVLLLGEWAHTPLRPFSTVLCLNLKHLRDDLFGAVSESLVIVEPDLLYNATDLAECFQKDKTLPLLYLWDKFKRSLGSASMVKGNIVGELLTARLRRSPETTDQVFWRCVKRNALTLMTLDANVIETLYDDIQQPADVIEQVVSRLPQTGILIEPTYLSADYGLLGRPDVVIETPNAPRQVIELKSGGYPKSSVWATISGVRLSADAWMNHFAQATTYDLLLHSAYPDGGLTTSILYSADTNAPLRNLAVTPLIRKALIQLRNELVDIDLSLAAGDTGWFDLIDPSTMAGAPSYELADLANFAKTRRLLTDAERALFDEFAAFIAREHLIARVGGRSGDGQETGSGFAGLWLDSIREKRAALLNFAKLEWVAAEAGEQRFRVGEPKDFIANFREGDPIILYPHAPDLSAQPLKGQLWKGMIRNIDRTTREVTVRLSNQDARLPAAPYWAADHDLLDSSFTGMYASLRRFAEADPDRRALLLGGREPVRQPVVLPRSQRINALTPSQRNIFTKAVEAQDYFLLQGPPGTGKTRVMLAALVDYWLNHSSDTLLLLAFTNRAVNEMCEALEGTADYIRFGARDTLPDRIAAHHFDTLVETLGLDGARQRLKQCRVIITTVTTASTRPELFAIKTFETAVVDEASQLLEPHLLGILATVKRFVLIGDEKQLPAVVTQPPKDCQPKHPALGELGIRSLSQSLFERLLTTCQQRGWTHAYGMLEQQGRMHLDIQAFPSRQFYGDKLQVLGDGQRAPIRAFKADSADAVERLLSSQRVLFIVSNAHARRPKTHPQEAERVAFFLRGIRAAYERNGLAFDPTQTVGVITPFRAQIAEIYARLPDDLQEVTVDTVERFQGGQRDIILVSFAVQNLRQMMQIESLNDDETVDRKLNVALTRAREHLILFGDGKLLSQHRQHQADANRAHFRALIQYLHRERKAVITDFEALLPAKA